MVNILDITLFVMAAVFIVLEILLHIIEHKLEKEDYRRYLKTKDIDGSDISDYEKDKMIERNKSNNE